MKLPLPIVAAFTLALGTLGAAPPPPPTLPIDQALKLAQDHLTERGLTGEHYISGLTLEEGTIIGGQRYWVAHWVPSIKLDKTSETGLRINMDGTLARLVSGGPNGGRPDAPGQRRIGARDIR